MELNQASFERLVQLYLLSVAMSLGIVAYEALSPAWSAFSEAYDALVVSHFGESPEELGVAAGSLGMAALLWHFASAIGLLRYKRWARLGFWASILFFSLMTATPLLWDPMFQSSWLATTETIGMALLGAIVLLSYSDEHGRVWFMKPMERLKDTF